MSPKATLIISVYKNVPFLKAVLDSLAYQTRQDFEVIVSEDGESPEVRQFVSLYPFGVPFRHLTQKDAGWRKNRALNRAIIAARAEHLVFIDGDCVLHPRFMEAHITHFRPDRVLAGLRVLLGESQSRALLDDSAYVLRLQKVVWKSLLFKNGIERPRLSDVFSLYYDHEIRYSWVIQFQFCFRTGRKILYGAYFDKELRCPGKPRVIISEHSEVFQYQSPDRRVR